METYTVEALGEMKATLDKDKDYFSSVFESALFYYLPEYQGESNDRQGTYISEEYQPLDVVGQKAAQTLAAGIFSNTVSLGSEFFGFRTNDDELNDNEAVRRYFSDAAKLTLQALQNSNYASSTFETILYYSVLNTGIQYSEFSVDKMIYQNIPVTQCSLAEDKDGMVNTIFRSFEMTAQQAYEKWGDDNHQNILTAYKDSNQRFAKYKFYHAVLPRIISAEDREKLGPEYMPFASCYVDETNGHKLEEGGYNSFPYACPRFYRISTTPLGRGPSFACLPTVREIDRLRADIIDGVELKLQPPVFLPAGSVDEDVDLTPASINYYNPAAGGVVFYQPDIDIQGGQVQRADLKNDVMGMFFADLFTPMEDLKNMTATEVNARMSEKAQAITPVVHRLYDELFSPTITRTFELLIEKGVIPPPPEELNGKDYTVEYTTRLSALLKQVESNSAVNATNIAASLLQISAELPSINSLVDVDKMIKRIFEAQNVDNDLLYSEEETAEIRKAAKEAADKQRAAEAAVDKIGNIDPNVVPESGSMAAGLAEGQL